jgi:hypothetical protein
MKKEGNPMSEAEDFLRDARKSFHLAADSIKTRDIEHYAGMGRVYLQLAHEAAEIVAKP